MGRGLATILIAAAVLAWPVAAQSLPGTAVPTLQAVRTDQPFTVRGIHFRPFERVKLTLDATWAKRVKADVNGRFVGVFRGVAIDVCDGFTLRAVGSKGSRASLRALARECPSRNPG